MTMTLTYPDGSEVEFADGTTGGGVAEAIGSRLAKAAIVVRHDGVLFDLDRPLPGDGTIEIITDTSDDGREVMRHSSAHVLAQAVLDLYEGADFAIGPPIENGFYYDFDIGRPFTPDDLERIQARMEEIIVEDQPFELDYIDHGEALEIFSEQPFKTEILKGVDQSEMVDGHKVSVYRNLDFVDLCRGPHVRSTGRLKAVRLMRSSGAYWRGDEKNPQLQRIYGTAWESEKALQEHLEWLEEAELRDHRRLGAELDLYSFPNEMGPGLAVWHPKGAKLRTVIQDHNRVLHERYGFEPVFSPNLAKQGLWETSGHIDWYADGLYPAMELDDGVSYRVKPMNCPFHILIYSSHSRSYRELPMRLAELGNVYRYELSGTVHGLLRSRGFTQDDSHTFATLEQIPEELGRALDFTQEWFADLGFDEIEFDLSLRDPDKDTGMDETWDHATEILRDALKERGLEYDEQEAEAAFYGPKIDVHVRDALGRRWQCSTIQLDFYLPERFDLEYNTSENTTERPVMLHHAKAGSIERFIGILVEHYAGAFPMWMAPVQATIVPVADRHLDYADKVRDRLGGEGLRVEVDSSTEKLGEKIRRAMTAKVPVVMVVGDKDVESDTVGFRRYGEESEERGVAVTEALQRLKTEGAPPS
ncbi:MAG: threonine--tRNA ligase [Acidimicrobiia bacterium]|nr:threonine--tRNA ligase [Acidimicrobiia bacterium]